MSATDPSAALRAAGLRITRPRIAVLDLLTHGAHLSADEVRARLATAHPMSGSAATEPLSLQSVHNVLRDLTDAALVRRIEPADSPALYERRVGDNHHHVVCRGCGAVADVDCVGGAAPCLHIPAQIPDGTAASGFRIDLAEVVFWGWCARCQADGRAETPQPIESPRRTHVAHHHE